jgi:hypothetical protein
MFRTLTNYLLLPEPLSHDAIIATNQVYAALTAGRCYFVNRLDGDAPSIVFRLSRPNALAELGDTLSLTDSPLLVEVDVGADAYVRLIVNGEVMTSGVRRIRQTVTDDGVYRVEAYWGGKPWLFTNPIFVTP